MHVNAIVISPSLTDSRLEFAAEELQRVINFLHPERVLVNAVTLQVIADQVADRQWDYVFILGHGSSQGIALSNGEFWTADELIQTFKGREPKLIYFNTCESLDVAVQAFESLGCSVIFTRVEIPDRQAFVTGVELARALSETKDIREAYERSRPPSSRNYILLNGTIRANSASPAGDLARLILESNMDVARRIALLHKRLDSLDVQIEELGTVIHDWKNRGPTFPPTNRLMWAIGYILLILVLIISGAEVIRFLELSLPAWILLVILLGGASFTFLAAGLNILPWRI